jgi:hypothetical protein
LNAVPAVVPGSVYGEMTSVGTRSALLALSQVMKTAVVPAWYSLSRGSAGASS